MKVGWEFQGRLAISPYCTGRSQSARPCHSLPELESPSAQKGAGPSAPAPHAQPSGLYVAVPGCKEHRGSKTNACYITAFGPLGG